MRSTRKLSALLSLLAASTALAACSPKASDSGMELTAEEVLATDPHPERAQDEVRQQIGRQFIVEHFEARANALMLKAIETQRPAGFVFWNSNSASGTELREVIRTYAAKAAQDPSRAPLLYSTDYEGGGLNYTPKGTNTIGIQRFRKGVTGLVHPAWLERSMSRYGTELCGLQGEIMAKELASVGINYPLTMVADLQSGLFALRSVSKDPKLTSECLKAAFDPFSEEGHVIFVTKHFPGLGQTRGDTHDGTIISKVTDPKIANDHLSPFQALIDESTRLKSPELLSVLASHAKFPLFDPNHLTTESPKILRGLLREKMGFRGLVVSDAMWMGEYGSFSLNQMLPVYLNSFISGMDILMIKGSHYAGAVKFFREVYDNEVSSELKAAATSRTGLPWETVREKFMQRLKSSSQRLDIVTARVGDARKAMSPAGSPAKTLTTKQRSRYDQILESLDPAWRQILQTVRANEGA